MEAKTIKCKQCKKEFKVAKFNPRFPRRYCDICAKKRKKMWDNRHLVKFEDCENA